MIVAAPTVIGAVASHKKERRAPHVEDTLGCLSRSLPAAAGQSSNYGVVAQVRWPGPFVLLLVPPMLLCRVSEGCEDEGCVSGRIFKGWEGTTMVTAFICRSSCKINSWCILALSG